MPELAEVLSGIATVVTPFNVLIAGGVIVAAAAGFARRIMSTGR